MELNSKNIKRILFIIFCGAVIFSAIQNIETVFSYFGRIFSIFSPVIAAFCIAFVLNVLLSGLENKVFRFMDKSKKKFIRKSKRPICLVLTYLIAFGLVSLLLLVIIPDIIDTITYLAERLPSFVIQVREWAQDMLIKFNITQFEIPELKINWVSAANTLKDWVSSSYKKIFGDAVNITTSVFSGMFDTIFSFVISAYILAQKERIGKFIKRAVNAFIPQKTTEVIYHIASRTQESFSRFIGGQFTEALILSALCFIGMTILRIPNALIISVLIGVTSLVPIVGATVGVIVGFLLIVITSPLKAILFVIFFLVLQQIEGNLIYPKVVGKAVGLPGVIVVSSVLVGGNIGGILGTLIAVPTSATLFVLIKEAIAVRQSKKEKN